MWVLLARNSTEPPMSQDTSDDRRMELDEFKQALLEALLATDEFKERLLAGAAAAGIGPLASRPARLFWLFRQSAAKISLHTCIDLFSQQARSAC